MAKRNSVDIAGELERTALLYRSVSIYTRSEVGESVRFRLHGVSTTSGVYVTILVEGNPVLCNPGGRIA